MFPKDKYGSDLEHLAFMASYLTKEISTELSDDVMFTHNAIWDKVGGRQLRRIYPRGACEVIRNTSSPTRLYFVGFFGDSAEYDDTIRTKLWSLDDALSSELKNQLHIIAYVSSEVVPNGNWCNLVVLTSPEGVEQWRNVASHEDAVSVSPHIYKTVRIHFGEISGGLDNSIFVPLRTTFLEYPGQREVVQWS